MNLALARGVLVAARNILADPTRVTTRSYARRHDETGCAAGDRGAVAWCALGALYRERFDITSDLGHTDKDADDAEAILIAVVPKFVPPGDPDLVANTAVAWVNDELDHAVVHAFYDAAIDWIADLQSH